MSRTLARTLTVAGLSLGLALPALGATANADPKRGDLIPLTCGSTTYQIAVNGNGEWTPAHDTGSSRVFVPHAFGDFHGVIRDASGEIVDEFTEPGSTQGSGKQKSDLTCTYSFEEVGDGSDPDFPEGFTFSGSGTVTGKWTGRA